MNLRTLLEDIRERRGGDDDWPVFVNSLRKSPEGDWREIEGVRIPIETVTVAGEDVLLIGDSDSTPLSIAELERRLTELPPDHGEFAVEYCAGMPIVVNDTEYHIDVPLNAVGRDKEARCYLIACLVAD